MKFLLIFLILLSSCVYFPKQAFVNEDVVSQIDPVVIEEMVKDEQPSFDKNEQNSGIIDFETNKGWLITERALLRYNKLIEKFGPDFSPALNSDFGVTKTNETPRKIYLTQEAMVNFAIMNHKNKIQ